MCGLWPCLDWAHTVCSQKVLSCFMSDLQDWYLFICLLHYWKLPTRLLYYLIWHTVAVFGIFALKLCQTISSMCRIMLCGSSWITTKNKQQYLFTIIGMVDFKPAVLSLFGIPTYQVKRCLLVLSLSYLTSLFLTNESLGPTVLEAQTKFI